MMKSIKNALRPSLEKLTSDLRAAKAELTEAQKKYPNALDSLYGLPDTAMVAAAIDHCQAAMKVRDTTLAFKQGDTESAEIYGALAEKLSSKADEARKLEAAVNAAKDALDVFCREVDADVEKTADQIRALNTRRRAEDMPGARDMLNDHDRKFWSLLGDLQLAKAAEWIRRPVPGRDPSEGDLIQGRINEIKRGDTARETRCAVKAMPSWEDRDAWVAKWLSADKAGREEMAERARGAQAKARGWR